MVYCFVMFYSRYLLNMAQNPQSKAKSKQFQSTINGKFCDMSPTHVFSLLMGCIDGVHKVVYTRSSILFHKLGLNSRRGVEAPFEAGVFLFNL